MYMPDGSDYEYRVSDLLGTVINRSCERVLLEEMRQTMEMIGGGEKEILEILRILHENATESDTEDTLLGKVNSIVTMHPSWNGIGIDFNEIVRLYLKQRKQRS